MSGTVGYLVETTSKKIDMVGKLTESSNVEYIIIHIYFFD